MCDVCLFFSNWIGLDWVGLGWIECVGGGLIGQDEMLSGEMR